MNKGMFTTMFTRDNRSPQGKGPAPFQELTHEELIELGQSLGGKRTMDMGKGDNPDIPTGFVPLGQFLAHDISFDPFPVSAQPVDLRDLHNLRTSAFDLDSLYGEGPDLNPYLYNTDRRGQFVLDEGKEFDLPRNHQGTALIGDLRNDSNLLLAQLHLAFLKFHNAVYDQLNNIDDEYSTEEKIPEGRFERAQRLVRWHYQWIVLREFLPRIVGPEIVVAILRGQRRFYIEKGPSPAIPVEFSAAAFRFGHSQTHAVYRINDHSGRLPLFTSKTLCNKRGDLRGGKISRDYAINWKYFFNTGVRIEPLASRDSKKIGTELPGPLLHNTPGQPGESPSLAVRDLLRGRQRGLLSGQEVAQELKVEPLAEKDLWDGNLQERFQGKAAPLWYYILKEAEHVEQGKKLGPVGGHIVAEVIIGLLQEDPNSFLNKGRGDVDHIVELLQSKSPISVNNQLRAMDKWRPVLPIERHGQSTKGDFTIVDLLQFAKVDTQ